MAIIQSALLSKGRGSAGSVTFRRLNGKTVVSEKPLVVKNPDSFQQRRARMLFMAGGNYGWALSPYFATRDKLSGVRRDAGISKRGSKLLPIQDFIKRAVNLFKNDSQVFTQISSMAQDVPSNQVDYALKTAVVFNHSGPLFNAMKNIDVTGLPKENSVISLSQVSYSSGVAYVQGTIAEGAGVTSVNVKVYIILVSQSQGIVNRYLISRNVVATADEDGFIDIELPVQIPTGQNVHQIIAEVVPVVDVTGTENYLLAVGDNFLLNG